MLTASGASWLGGALFISPAVTTSLAPSFAAFTYSITGFAVFDATSLAFRDDEAPTGFWAKSQKRQCQKIKLLK